MIDNLTLANANGPCCDAFYHEPQQRNHFTTSQLLALGLGQLSDQIMLKQSKPRLNT